MINMYRFEVYTDYTDDGELEYIVKYFDFENVIGVGDSIEEAIEEAKSNLEFYIQYCKEKNITIPEPSKREENNFSGKVTLRMSKTMHKLVTERSNNEGVSINSFLNEAIACYISAGIHSDIIVEKACSRISTVVEEYLGESFMCINYIDFIQKDKNEPLFEEYSSNFNGLGEMNC